MASRLLRRTLPGSVFIRSRGWKRYFLVKWLGWLGILGLSVAILPAQEASPLFVATPSTNQPASRPAVAMGWLASPDTNVVGYYLCWGLASGQCTNFINVGNVTNSTLGGLSTNVDYYFTVVAYDAAGDQAVPSNEIQYIATNQISLVPPTIVADLTNQTSIAGSSASLQVQVAGSAPLSYQWLFNGTALPGVTSSALNLSKLTSTQAGTYQVVVTNAAGSVDSSIATLAVLISPTITLDVANQSVGVGSKVTFQVGVSGTGPFSYQWLFNGAMLPNATSNPLLLNNVTLAQAGSYQVVVTSPAGSVSSSLASLVVATPLSIVTDLTNQTITTGLSASFYIGVSGTPPLHYQWLFNGSILAGASARELDLTNVSFTQAGTYQVVVSNASEELASSLVTLDVIASGFLSISPMGNGIFKLTYGGAPNQNYAVEYCNGMNAVWQTQTNLTTDSTGALTYLASPNASSGYFRVAGP